MRFFEFKQPRKTNLIYENSENVESTIYVDMDGVIVDLYNHIGKMLGKHYGTITGDEWENFYQKVDAYKLFKTAPMFDSAFTLLELVKKHSSKHQILSTPLIYNTDRCIVAKKEWLKSHAPEWAANPIFTNSKEKYAVSNGIPNILIDDSASVIRKWEAAGGIAIKYKADEDNIQVVVNGLKKAAAIIKDHKSKIEQDKQVKETSTKDSKPELQDIIEEVLPIIKAHLKINSLPTIHFVKKVIDKHQPTFGVYKHGMNRLFVAIGNRHPVDIIRTLAHELVHYKQDLENRLGPHSGETGSDIENQAHAVAGVIMRHINKKYPHFLELESIQ